MIFLQQTIDELFEIGTDFIDVGDDVVVLMKVEGIVKGNEWDLSSARLILRFR